ncbi:MAG: hypothetical protein NTZ18_01000 [Candidatus Komeilibacteria bacterium]|nr:hypothetical protein [Candidatus Komeilibacteria bacterium]
MDQAENNKEVIDLSGRRDNSGAGLKFKDEQQMPGRIFQPGTSKIIQLVIKYSGGLIKNKRQANHVLIGFILLAVIVSLFLIFNGGGTAGSPKDIKILPAVF